MSRVIWAALVLNVALAAGEVDPLGAALAMPDGDVFAVDRIQAVLTQTPLAQRATAVQRIADSPRSDVGGVLHRLILDDDRASAALAIDALAKRWPTSLQDVEAIRPLIARLDRVGDAACRYAAVVGDDDALPALVGRSFLLTDDPATEQALRQLLSMPAGCGPVGWSALFAARQQREEAALAGAERLLTGSVQDAIGAVTLVVGMRPIGSRAVRVLLTAAEHPEATVRRMATSILRTCAAPPAVAWRKQPPVGAEVGAGPVLAAGSSDALRDPVAAIQVVSGAAALPPRLDRPAGSQAWLGWTTLLVLIGGGVWLMLRRRRAALPVAPAQGHITWAR